MPSSRYHPELRTPGGDGQNYGSGQQFPPCASVNPSAPDGPLDGIKLVDVEWEGKKAMMFTIDLQVRGELAEAAGNRPPGEYLVFKNPDWVYA